MEVLSSYGSDDETNECGRLLCVVLNLRNLNFVGNDIVPVDEHCIVICTLVGALRDTFMM